MARLGPQPEVPGLGFRPQATAPDPLPQAILEAMAWFIAAAALLLPFILLKYSRHPAGRVGLLLVWLACLAGGAFSYTCARKIDRDLETVHTYHLSASPGTHLVVIAPLSQRSMKGVLTGGAIALDPLKKPKWRFTDKFVPVTWFAAREHDPAEADQTLLFYVEWGGPDGPLTLEYQVDEEAGELLRGKSLIVTHDSSAKHMLRDHARVVLDLLAWVLCLWGGLWLVVSAAIELVRWKNHASRRQ